MTTLPDPRRTPRRFAAMACVAATGLVSALPVGAAPLEVPVAQAMHAGLTRVVAITGEGNALSTSVTRAAARTEARFSTIYGRQAGASWAFAFDDALARIEPLQYNASSGWVAFEPDAVAIVPVPARAAVGATGIIGCGKAVSLSAPQPPRSTRPLADWCLQWSVHPGTTADTAWVCLSRTLRGLTDAAPGLDARHQSCYLSSADGSVGAAQVWPFSPWRPLPGETSAAR